MGQGWRAQRQTRPDKEAGRQRPAEPRPAQGLGRLSEGFQSEAGVGSCSRREAWADAWPQVGRCCGPRQYLAAPLGLEVTCTSRDVSSKSSRVPAWPGREGSAQRRAGTSGTTVKGQSSRSTSKLAIEPLGGPVALREGSRSAAHNMPPIQARRLGAGPR